MKQIFTAKKLEEAKQKAVQAFGVSESQIVFRILEQKKGVLGIGASVTIEAIYEPVEEPVKSVEPVVVPVTEPVEPVAVPVPKTEPVATSVESVEPIKSEPVAPVAPEPVLEVEVEVEEATEPVVEPEEQTKPEEPTAVETSEEQMAAIERAAKYVEAVYRELGVASIRVQIVPQEGGALLELRSDNQSGTIIGRRGETLDSMQYLASIIANKGEEEYCRVILDSNGYREKRRQTLEHLAERLSKSVLRNKRSTALEPMNPYERRIIHAKVAEIEGVTSRSVGEDPFRKVIILPLDENGQPISTRRPKRNNRNGADRTNRSGERKNNGGYRGGNNSNPNRKRNHSENRNGGNDRNGQNRRRRGESIPQKPMNFDDLETSFEKDYRKPKPEDEMNIGLYGKIE